MAQADRAKTEVAATDDDGTAEPAEAPARTLLSLLSGAWVAQAIFIAVKLGIAGILHKGPASCLELAATTQAHAPSLHRVLRALASVGLFANDAEGRFALTPLADLLRRDAPGTLRAYAIMMGERWVWQSWGDIEHSVRTGQPAFEHVFGAPLFDDYTAHPNAGRVSADVLNSLSAADNAAIVAAYGFPGSGTVIDVGSRQGMLLAAILAASPGLRGVLFERPAVLEMARSRLVAAGVGARCELVGGRLLCRPSRWWRFVSDEKGDPRLERRGRALILACCRAAMPTTARLLIAEQVMPEGNQPSTARWLDLLMLVYAGGKERTEAEYRDLLAAAGFAINRTMPTAATIHVIEAIPV